MKFQVTKIEFDFTDDLYEEALAIEQQQKVINQVLNTVWEVDDEEDLVDSISDSTGWCVSSIDYCEV